MQRCFGQHFHRTALRDDGVRGERGLGEKRARDPPAVLTERRGAVDSHPAKAQLHDFAAIVRARSTAAGTYAAGRSAQDHVVALLKAADPLPYRLDDAGAFVTQNNGMGDGYPVSGMTVDIGVADSGGGDAHQNFIGTRLLEIQLLDPWMRQSFTRYGS